MTEVKLTFIYKMKLKISLLLLPLISLVSCSVSKEISRKSFYFDTYVDIRLFEGKVENLNDINQIFAKIDKLTDNFTERNIDNIYKINRTNENVVVEPELYDILNLSFSSNLASLNYFNPLCGSLSKKWKESLENKAVLSESVINEELTKMASSGLELLGDNTVRRTGESEIDLGAVAKGYALDKVKEYLDVKNIKKYLVDAGSSSILLGEKDGGKNFIVKVSNLPNSYLELKNCFVSTSSLSRQFVEIEDQKYSHIINPNNGSAINLHEAVIVISDVGYLGDILSTDFVNESIDSIKVLEQQFNVKTIVIDNSAIAYKTEGLEVVNK